MKVTVWVEKLTDGQFWGRTSGFCGTFVTGYGETPELVIENIRMSMIAFKQKKGSHDEEWSDLDINQIVFELKLKA